MRRVALSGTDGTNGIHVSGTIDRDGRIALNGFGYFHGKAETDGRVSVHGPNGLYLSGRISGGQLVLNGGNGLTLSGTVSG